NQCSHERECPEPPAAEIDEPEHRRQEHGADDDPRPERGQLVPFPVMPPSFWVVSTATLAPRDRRPEAGTYCWKGHYLPPNLRSRFAYSASAARRSSSPKSGQGASTKTSSAYASCQ